MSKSLPSYTQREINRAFAQALLVGYDHVGWDTQYLIRVVSSGMYVLKPEDDDQKG